MMMRLNTPVLRSNYGVVSEMYDRPDIDRLVIVVREYFEKFLDNFMPGFALKGLYWLHLISHVEIVECCEWVPFVALHYEDGCWVYRKLRSVGNTNENAIRTLNGLLLGNSKPYGNKPPVIYKLIDRCNNNRDHRNDGNPSCFAPAIANAFRWIHIAILPCLGGV